MADKINWGLLSTAGINRALIPPIRASERSELLGVASRDLAKAKSYAAEREIPKAYGSYEEMLADPDIDAVYISLPNSMHCEWTVKAAEAGKHVLCEKPIAVSLAELDQMEAAGRANNVTIFEAFMYLHHPQTQTALQMVRDGKLGEDLHVTTWFQFYLPPENSQNIRLLPELTGGCLWDVGVYPNSMSITMVDQGVPESVWAQQVVGETGVDVGMRAQMMWPSSAIAQTSASFRTPYREGTHIVGNRGSLQILESWKPGIEGQDSVMIFTDLNRQQEEIVTPAVDPYLCEVQAMEACVIDGAAPVVTFEHSRNFLRNVLTLYRSAASGKVERVAETASA